MSHPQPPNRVKLVIGLFMKNKGLFPTVSAELTECFGPVDLISRWYPFDFTTSLSRIDTKTIVTNGLNDFIVPFESIKRMYKHMNQENTILVGFKNTGHVALASDNFSFIIEMIEIYLNSSSKQNVTEFVMKNDQAMIF